jgi:hypothetical protein
MSATLSYVHDVSAEELAEFKRGLNALDPVSRRIMALLIPRLIALEEMGDTEGAIRVIDEIRLILWDVRHTRH